MIKIENININLKDTITCGQIFRYIEEDDNSYTVLLSDRVVNIKKDNNTLYVKSSNEEDLENVIKNYLDLNRDYEKLNKELLLLDNNLKDIIKSCDGFKIINQPKLEAHISYIISQNNRVPQIRNTLNNISKNYGKKVIFEGKEYYLFPGLEKLKKITKEDFRKMKTGFRDEYLYEFIKRVNSKEFELDLIDNMNSEDAMKYLMKNKGIGEKVASCILLFSYSRFDVFPIDTWVKKYMKDTYNIEGVNNIKKFTNEKYKGYTGLIIQYMFHYKRNKEN